MSMTAYLDENVVICDLRAALNRRGASEIYGGQDSEPAPDQGTRLAGANKGEGHV